jgi:hypothetical protein
VTIGLGKVSKLTVQAVRKEIEMYDTIKRHFEQQNYRVVADKPPDSGIYLKSLKGWRIDVVAVKKEQQPEVIAVEVKSNIGMNSVLDALSKAEMYRNVCTKAYVAFPREALEQDKLMEHQIRQECERRGIGILQVGAQCTEILGAHAPPLRVEMQRELIDEIARKSRTFEGFEEQDFVRFCSRFRKDREITWRRFNLLGQAVETRLRRKSLFLAHQPTREKWWFSFSRPSKARYYEVPHFSVVFWHDGQGIMTELIIRGRAYTALRASLESNPGLFRKNLSRLRNLPYECEAKVMSRTPVATRQKYKTRPKWEFMANNKHLDENVADRLADILQERGRNKWLWIGRLFHLREEHTRSGKLVDCVDEFVQGLAGFYDYAWKSMQ